MKGVDKADGDFRSNSVDKKVGTRFNCQFNLHTWVTYLGAIDEMIFKMKLEKDKVLRRFILI